MVATAKMTAARSPPTNAKRQRTLPYPPPWQDMDTLCEHICATPPTVEKWIVQGVLPAARKRGGKLMWKWSEVDEMLTNGKAAGSAGSDADRIRDDTRKALEENRAGH
jgi:hypothetical protein